MDKETVYNCNAAEMKYITTIDVLLHVYTLRVREYMFGCQLNVIEKDGKGCTVSVILAPEPLTMKNVTSNVLDDGNIQEFFCGHPFEAFESAYNYVRRRWHELREEEKRKADMKVVNESAAGILSKLKESYPDLKQKEGQL